MWGATAGRAVVPAGGQEEARAAREPHTCKTGPRFDVGRDRRARGRSGGRARRSSRGARAPHGQGKTPLRMWGATAGRAVVQVGGQEQVARRATTARDEAARRPMRASAATTDGADVGRDRRARGRSGGRARRSSRGARAPHSKTGPRFDVGRDRRARGRSSGRARRSSRGARAPHGKTDLASMWDATAGRAVVPGGRARRSSRGARAPHGQDRTSLRCGTRPPGARTFRREGKKKLARRASPTRTRQDPS